MRETESSHLEVHALIDNSLRLDPHGPGPKLQRLQRLLTVLHRIRHGNDQGGLGVPSQGLLLAWCTQSARSTPLSEFSHVTIASWCCVCSLVILYWQDTRSPVTHQYSAALALLLPQSVQDVAHNVLSYVLAVFTI